MKDSNITVWLGRPLTFEILQNSTENQVQLPDNLILSNLIYSISVPLIRNMQLENTKNQPKKDFAAFPVALILFAWSCCSRFPIPVFWTPEMFYYILHPFLRFFVLLLSKWVGFLKCYSLFPHSLEPKKRIILFFLSGLKSLAKKSF